MKILQLTQGKVALIDDEDDNGLKWYFGSNGYANNKSYDKKGILLHRFVMERKLGRKLKSKEHVEHRNGFKLDCQRDNLRLCNPTLNQANAKIRSDNTTGAKGISLDKRNGRYIAQFYIKSKKYHLGTYATLEEAKLARRRKELKMYGEYALQDREDPFDKLPEIR